LDKTRGVNAVSAGDVLAGPVNGLDGKSKEASFANAAIKPSIVKDPMDSAAAAAALAALKGGAGGSALDRAAASARELAEAEAATEAAKVACSIINGEECEACQ